MTGLRNYLTRAALCSLLGVLQLQVLMRQPYLHLTPSKPHRIIFTKAAEEPSNSKYTEVSIQPRSRLTNNRMGAAINFSVMPTGHDGRSLPGHP